MTMKAILLERGLVAVATVIVAWVAVTAMDADDDASLSLVALMMIAHGIMLMTLGPRDSELRKIRKAAGNPGPTWEVPIFIALLVAAVAFAWQFRGAVSVAVVAAVAVVGLWLSYRDLQRLQAAGHIQ